MKTQLKFVPKSSVTGVPHQLVSFEKGEIPVIPNVGDFFTASNDNHYRVVDRFFFYEDQIAVVTLYCD